MTGNNTFMLKTVAVRRHLRLLVKSQEYMGDKPDCIENKSIIGFVERKGSQFPYSIPDSSRNLHSYISGKPGTGKSTFLMNLALKDILRGRGCCVIDPHGDLIENLLERIPDQIRFADRIVIFDPSDVDRPVGLNILQDITQDEQDATVQFIISLFNKLYPPDYMGPIFYQAIRNGLLLTMENHGTLMDLSLVFEDENYMDSFLKHCQTPWVRNYFEKVWKRWGNERRGEYMAYFSSKFSHFIENRMLRNILCQRKGLDIGRLLNEKKVVLINLSRGKIGDLNAKLLGLLIGYSLERAMMRRVEIPEEERELFNVYIDEFQEFIPTTMDTFLSSARKYRIGLHLASQSIYQLKKEFRTLILANVGIFVIFRQGIESAWTLSELTGPKYNEIDLTRIPDYHAVICMTNLGKEMAPELIRVENPSSYRNKEVAIKLKEISRINYGREKRKVEEEIQNSFRRIYK